MQIKNIGPNQTEVRTPNGNVILFSYNTPVAAFNLRLHDTGGGFDICQTETKHSATTTKHIRKWAQCNPKTKPQAFFYNLS